MKTIWGTRKRAGVQTMRINGHDVRLLTGMELKRFRSHINMLCTGAQPKPIRLREK